MKIMIKNYFFILFLFITFISDIILTNDQNVYADDTTTTIGKIIKLNGDAYAELPDGDKRNLRIGSSIFEKDTIYMPG